MTTQTTQAAHATGSARRWGPLWGARPADWALNEDRQTPTYEAALARVGLEPGQAALEIGCGVGTFLRLVADRRARAFGLDASTALIDFAPPARAPGRPARRRHGGPALPGRQLRPRHRLQLVPFRQRHRHRHPRGRPSREAR